MLPKTPRQGEFVRYVEETGRVWPALIVLVRDYATLDLFVWESRNSQGEPVAGWEMKHEIRLHPERKPGTWHWPSDT